MVPGAGLSFAKKSQGCSLVSVQLSRVVRYTYE